MKFEKRFFSKTNIDITNDKSMFNYIKNHYKYYTMNSWNGVESIANNVKLYNLGLEGDYWNAYRFLQQEDYMTVNDMLYEFEHEHPNFTVNFNGRGGGYLVLGNKGDNRSVLPGFIEYCDTYEDYKEYCKDWYGSMKENRSELVFYTKLIRDFDRLCDDLREYVNNLSNISFENETMVLIVDMFNEEYYDDLKRLEIRPISIVNNKMDYRDLCQVGTSALLEAFKKVANRYVVDGEVKYKNGFAEIVA